jgi:glycosyltransferase involved in cell wall biosynthesis
MKILHINYFDIIGGAAKAAYKLHKALLEKGVNSIMLVQEKAGNDDSVIGPSNFIEKYYGKARYHYDRFKIKKYKSDFKYLFSPSNTSFSYIPRKIKRINPDVVHLHWFQANMLSLRELMKIKKPIIWTVHDMWGLTGGCFYSIGCSKYLERCGKCPILNSDISIDLSRKLIEEKKKVYKKLNITIVSPSKWLKKEFEKLNLSSNVINIPNIVNFHTFNRFENKEKLRKSYKIPLNSKVILFIAMSIKDKNKGFNFVEKVLKMLNNKFTLLIVGAGVYREKTIGRTQIINFGRIVDESQVNEIYNIADITVVPSIQENFSNIILESLSAGTPVIAFDIGGNSDAIIHKKNGYLVKPYDLEKMKKGFEWLLTDENLIKCSNFSRISIIKEFPKEKIVNSYISLYNNLIHF